MKYGIAVFPSSEIQDRANSLRKRYDSHYNLIPPHITIKEPFECENVEEAVNHIEEVVGTIPPFTLKVTKVRSFAPTTSVLYLAVEGSQVIHDLQKKLNTGTFFQEPRYQFIPHITIAQDIHEQEIFDIYSRLKLKDFEMEFTVDRIHLLYQLENGAWSNYQTFILKG